MCSSGCHSQFSRVPSNTQAVLPVVMVNTRGSLGEPVFSAFWGKVNKLLEVAIAPSTATQLILEAHVDLTNASVHKMSCRASKQCSQNCETLAQ